MERSSYQQLLTRRETLLAALSAAALGTLGAGCAERSEPSAKIAGRFFDADELALLANVVEIVIPTTDTPGARAAKVHLFIDALMADWANGETQLEIRRAVNSVNTAALARHDADFNTLPESRQIGVVAAVDAAAFAADAEAGSERRSFRRLKELIFRGFYLSRIGATEELRFELVPGEFRGCVPLAEVGRTWAT